MGWSHFSHEADIGLRGTGVNKATAFEAIAQALTAVVTDLDNVAITDVVEINCRARNDELLLVDWLNALIYEMATRKMLFREFDVNITNGELSGTASGERVNTEKHRPAVEVKGATNTMLAVEQYSDGWKVQCVVDV